LVLLILKLSFLQGDLAQPRWGRSWGFLCRGLSSGAGRAESPGSAARREAVSHLY